MYDKTCCTGTHPFVGYADNAHTIQCVVGISGAISSGKSTTAKLIQENIEQYTNWPENSQPAYTAVRPFATTLKQAVHLIFGVPINLPYEDRDLPIEHFNHNCPITDDHMWTARALYQFMGTEVGRFIYPSVWVDRWYEKAQRQPVDLIICDDVRFMEEKTAMQKNFAKVPSIFIYVERSENPSNHVNSNHRSETEAKELLRPTADFVITASNKAELLAALTEQEVFRTIGNAMKEYHKCLSF